MEPFAFDFDNLKTEKQSAMLRYRRLRYLPKLFRIFEFCLFLILVSWISTRVPFILKISTDYILRLISILLSPLFIFLLSNVIVIILVLKSGQVTSSSSEKSEINLYTEFTKNIEIGVVEPEAENCSIVSEEETVYQDKQIVGEINTVRSDLSCDLLDENDLLPDDSISEQKVFLRSRSENLKTESQEKPGGELRRSESDVCQKSERSGESTAEIVEELSNEEFQRAIEAYIEKQLKFHKQEQFCIVPHV